MRPPALLRLTGPLLAALAGCFVDNAPVIPPPGDESSTGTTSGAPAGSTGDETTGDGQPIADSHADTAPDATSTTTAPDTTTTTATTIADPTDPAPACADLADSPCLECACRECADAFAACQADRGCVAIMACAAANGCLGVECLGPCADVIDEHGGPLSPSATAALTLSVCAEDKCGC